MGGQTALNLCIDTGNKGLWKKYNIKIVGVDIDAINITENREEFRKKSLISKAANGIICGFGINGYIMALDSIKKILSK